eukprot:1841769-Amphidinium_carterae.1
MDESSVELIPTPCTAQHGRLGKMTTDLILFLETERWQSQCLSHFPRMKQCLSSLKSFSKERRRALCSDQDRHAPSTC